MLRQKEKEKKNTFQLSSTDINFFFCGTHNKDTVNDLLDDLLKKQNISNTIITYI